MTNAPTHTIFHKCLEKWYVSIPELTNCWYSPLSWCNSSLKKNSINFCPGVYAYAKSLCRFACRMVYWIMLSPVYPMAYEVTFAPVISIEVSASVFCKIICLLKNHKYRGLSFTTSLQFSLKTENSTNVWGNVLKKVRLQLTTAYGRWMPISVCLTALRLLIESTTANFPICASTPGFVEYTYKICHGRQCHFQ